MVTFLGIEKKYTCSTSSPTYFVTAVTVGMEGKTMIYICFVSFTKQTSLGKRVNDPTSSFFKYLLCSRKFKLNLKYKEIFLHSGNQQ